MSHPIKSIEISNIRGIRHTTLPVDGQNLVLVGENGSGKSSIVDAIEYFFTGHVVSLEGRQDVSTRQAFPNINGGPTEVVLGWGSKENPTKVSAKFPTHSLDVPAGMQEYFDAAGSRSFILHRAQLLNFILARDGERYNQISEIIGLGDLDTVDGVWRAELNEATKERDQHNASLGRILSRLSQVLNAPAITSESDIALHLNRQLAVLGVDGVQGRFDVSEREEAVRQLCQSTADQERLQRARVVKEMIDQLTDQTAELGTAYGTLVQTIRRLLNLTAGLEEAHLERLLQQAVTVLEQSPDMANCPVCEQPIAGAGELLARIRSRLKVLIEFTACQQDVSKHTITLRDRVRAWDMGLEHLIASLRELDLIESLQSLEAARAAAVQWMPVILGDDRSAKLDLELDKDSVILSLSTRLSDLAVEVDEKIADLAPDQVQKTAFDVLSRLSAVGELWRGYEVETRDLQAIQRVVSQLDLVYKHLLAARIRGLQHIAAELQEDFARLYSELHPDEGCKSITLWVPEDRRASVGLRVGYYDQDSIHPLNYFSEGHLDSLGLCIFLAFIRRFNGNLRLMVLDDVWTAVDAGHRLRVAQLLRKEFEDYQIIVTTHYRLWAEHLNIVLPNSKLYRLRPWNLELGTCCQQIPPSDWNYYREQINDGRAQDAIAGVGRNLEKFLHQMRGNLGIAVPATRNGNYTIGHLYGPFFKWMKKHRPITRGDWSGFDDDIQAMDEELDSVWRLRNWSGAHFNEWATQVSSREALDFLNAVEELVSAFSCPVCGDLVIYDEDTNVLRCPNCQPSPLPRFVPQYKPDWPAGVDRMLAGGDPRAIAGVGPKLTGVLRRFLADVGHYLSLELDDESGGLATRYAALLVWAHQHPREDVAGWADVVSAMEQTLSAYWQEPQGTVIPDEAKVCVFRVISDFTSLFTRTVCNNLLRYHSERENYYCPECEKQGQPVQRVSAYWYTGRS